MTTERKTSKLTAVWQEFVDALIAYMENCNEETRVRFYKAMEDYPVGEKESDQEDWVWETKQIIKDIAIGKREAWTKIYNFIKERYREHDYHEQILIIAKEKGIGEPAWIL